MLPARANGGGRAGDDRTPPPALVAPLAGGAETPEPIDKDGQPAVFRSRAERYRFRVVASAAFAVLTFVTMVAVVVALRYASEHAAAVDEAAAQAAQPAQGSRVQHAAP